MRSTAPAVRRADLILPAWRGDGTYFDRESLTLYRGVQLNGERAGSIALVFDLRQFRSRYIQYSKISLLVILVSVLATFLIASRLAHSIGDPLVKLAAVARHISTEKDYSIRAGIRVRRRNRLAGRLLQRDAHPDRIARTGAQRRA